MKIKYIGNKREKKIDTSTSKNINSSMNTNNEHDLIDKYSKLNTNNSNTIDKNIKKPHLPLNSDNKKDKRRYKVLDQLNFYFSDENIIFDKFLRSILQSNTEQAIKIETLLSFNKIKNLLKEVNEDYRYYYIFISVKNYSNFLCLSSNQKAVKRKEEFNFSKFKELQNEIDQRSVFIDSKQKLSLKRIEELFSPNIAFISKNKTFITFKDAISCENVVSQYSSTNIENENSNKKNKGKSFSFSVIRKLDWLKKASQNSTNIKNMDVESFRYRIIVDKNDKYKVKDHIFESLNKKKIKEIRFANIDQDKTEVIALFNNLEEMNNSIDYFSGKEYSLMHN